jgi:hypothetical protein
MSAFFHHISAFFHQPIEPPNDLSNRTKPAVVYRIANLWTRLAIGILGISLPFIFIIGDGRSASPSLRGDLHVRGSISAYYHTSMRDIYVASFCMTGLVLLTYFSGEPRTLDFLFSFVAGLAVFGVAFFPTTRLQLPPDAPRCGATPMPPGCSPVQQQLGEKLVAGIHFTFAAVFILSLAWICFVFASPNRRPPETGAIATILRLCGWVIVGAVVLAIVGGLFKFTIGELTPLYLAEVISVLAFGIAWLLKARDLKKAYGPWRDRVRAKETTAGGN